MNESIFSVIILSCLGLPIASFVILMLLGFLDKELDYLQLENKKIEMEKEVQKSEYLQLTQQIQPHFMFNSLNAMLSLSRLGKTADVTQALEEYSQFLHYKYTEKEVLVPFESELTYTTHYISIQSIRFRNKLQVKYDIDETAEPTYLPPYMLQTLVENAFKHGLDKKSGLKSLKISLIREGNWVSLSVIDNGPDMEEKQHRGIGLGNIRKRLALLYDLHTEVTLIRRDDVTIAKAVWPYTPEGKR